MINSILTGAEEYRDIFPIVMDFMRPCDVIVLRCVSQGARAAVDAALEARGELFGWSMGPWSHEGNMKMYEWYGKWHIWHAWPPGYDRMYKICRPVWYDIAHDAMQTNNEHAVRLVAENGEGMKGLFSGIYPETSYELVKFVMELWFAKGDKEDARIPTPVICIGIHGEGDTRAEDHLLRLYDDEILCEHLNDHILDFIEFAVYYGFPRMYDKFYERVQRWTVNAAKFYASGLASKYDLKERSYTPTSGLELQTLLRGGRITWENWQHVKSHYKILDYWTNYNVSSHWRRPVNASGVDIRILDDIVATWPAVNFGDAAIDRALMRAHHDVATWLYKRGHRPRKYLCTNKDNHWRLCAEAGRWVSPFQNGRIPKPPASDKAQ